MADLAPNSCASYYEMTFGLCFILVSNARQLLIFCGFFYDQVESSSSSGSHVTALAWILPVAIGGGLIVLVIGLLIRRRVTKSQKGDGNKLVDVILEDPTGSELSSRPTTGKDQIL